MSQVRDEALAKVNIRDAELVQVMFKCWQPKDEKCGAVKGLYYVIVNSLVSLFD